MGDKQRSDGGTADVEVTGLQPDDRQFTPPRKGVLVVYTGGTIGSAPKDRSDPESPQIVVPWEEFRKSVQKMWELDFPVDAISFVSPLDSANVGPRHWRKLAELVFGYYDKYAGFVIAHGTDTMVYTASALSFMLRGLSKPVIITGAQTSAVGQIRNDGEQNLLTSLLLANPDYSRLPNVPEVCIFFREKLIRGNRSRKIDAAGYAAFDSPNFPPLGVAGGTLDINPAIQNRKHTRSEINIQVSLEPNVVTFEVFPGLQDSVDLLRHALSSPQVKGVILKTYGAGNVATEPPDIVNAIREAVQRGVVVVNVTQCIRGTVEQGLYDTSAVLEDCGVVSGQEMTPEAARCKLMALLGDRKRNSPDEVRRRMTRNTAGELDFSIYRTQVSQEPGSADGGAATPTELPACTIEGYPADAMGSIHKALLRFVGGQIHGAEKGRILVFLNLADVESPSETSKRLAGAFRKTAEQTPQTYTFDVSRKVQDDPNKEASFSVLFDGPEGAHFSWERVELSLFVAEAW
jgi:L-asparaginase